MQSTMGQFKIYNGFCFQEAYNLIRIPKAEVVAALSSLKFDS